MNDACGGTRWSTLAGGIVLIAVGAVFLMDTLELADFGNLLRDGWPLIPVVIGIPMLFDRERRGGGITLIAVGAWMFVSNRGMFGLDWSSSWPVVLILVGGGMILNALIDAVVPRERREEDPHAPQR